MAEDGSFCTEDKLDGVDYQLTFDEPAAMFLIHRATDVFFEQKFA
ncbi:MAG: hypothetical protein OXH16_06200 [Gemmatimonadetes bacterium]|nr:hypothetical protein [Gemmatimonadota bacterium]